MKYILSLPFRIIFFLIALFLMLVFTPIGFIYGAAKRGFERGEEIGEDPTKLL